MRLQVASVWVLGAMLCSLTADAQNARVVRDLEYSQASGQSLQLDLHLPENLDAPLVVWFHGGGWVGGSRNPCPLDWLTAHRFAVASVSYRFSDVAQFPAQIHDCKAAIRWLRTHAKDHGYSGERIAVAGASAGGMLAALLGTSGGHTELERPGPGGLNERLSLEQPAASSRVQAVIDFYGATDFPLRSRTQHARANHPASPVTKLFGGGVDAKPALARLASAVTHVSADDPPLLIFHGAKDDVVLLDQSQAIERAYREAGLDVELVVLPEAGHGGGPFRAAAQRQRMLEFLKRTLNIPLE